MPLTEPAYTGAEVINLLPKFPVADDAAGAKQNASDQLASVTVVGLTTENEYLRQLLADAHEERRLQHAIAQDRLAEKQQEIDQLTKKLAMVPQPSHKGHSLEEIGLDTSFSICGDSAQSSSECFDEDTHAEKTQS